MKNLHLISAYNLSDKELSIIYYIETGHERHIEWKLKIEGGRLFCFKSNDGFGSIPGGIWVNVLTSNWSFDFPLSLWNKAGRPLPNFSILEK